MNRIGLSMAVCFLLLFGLTATVWANHHVYLSEDSAQQWSSQAGTENYAQYWWLLGADVWWQANPDVRDYMLAAVNNWGAAVPKLKWTEYSTADVAAAGVQSGYCGSPNAVACLVTAQWYVDTLRNANYPSKQIVALELAKLTDPDPNLERKKRVSVTAHELGHVYGLHERYNDSGSPGGLCNFNEISVMDGAGCDGWLEGPAPGDITAVDNFWGSGYLWVLDINPVNGTAEASWYDQAWGDLDHPLAWFWWDDTTSSWQWVGAWDRVANNVGFRYGFVEDPARHLSQTLNRSSFPNAPVNKWYTVCGEPWFNSYQKSGDWVCSDYMVWVTQ